MHSKDGCIRFAVNPVNIEPGLPIPGVFFPPNNESVVMTQDCAKVLAKRLGDPDRFVWAMKVKLPLEGE
jgi:hypothetical protein